MKTPSFLSLIFYFFLLFLLGSLSSCRKKEGCTVPCATNYDSKARKDDGSCMGCGNPKAGNYCPDAKISSENCTCGGNGFLTVENKSINTIQRVLIGNTNYGSLNPGEKKEIKLPEGSHQLEFQSLSGNGGCLPSQIIIAECGSEVGSCDF